MTARPCPRCDAVFGTLTDLGIHLCTAHDIRRRPHRERRWRTFSCWRCARELDPGSTACPCGWQVPA